MSLDQHPFPVPPRKAFDFSTQNRPVVTADIFSFSPAPNDPGSGGSSGSNSGNPFVFGVHEPKGKTFFFLILDNNKKTYSAMKPEIAPKPQVSSVRFGALNKWFRGESTPTIVDIRSSPPAVPPPGPHIKL